MLLGRTGPGTYSPAALLLVAISVLTSIAALRAPVFQSILPAAVAAKKSGITLAFIFLLSIGLGFATLLWIAPEGIDVYSFQRDGAAALVRGADPYSVTHQNLYTRNPSFYYGPGVVNKGRVEIGCPYPPLSLLAILPGYVLGDLRYAYLAMVILSGVLLVRMDGSPLTLVALTLLLLSPVTLFALSRSFTESFVLLTLCCTCLAAQRRSRWLPVALGAFFASKQYAVLGAPLAALLLAPFAWKSYERLLLKSAAFAALVTVPFAIWNWHDFWRDIVRFQIIQPFRPDALSFSVLAVRLGLPQIPQLLVIIAVFASITWSLRATPPRPAAFPGCFALVLLVFFCLNKQAFVNYYFLVIGAALLAAVMADSPPDPISALTYCKRAADLDVTVS